MPDPLPVTRSVLPNGLTVLVREDHAAPVVAIVTWVNAGYFDEPDADAGIAHVLEHMYFKGTPTRAVGEIARETKASGGYLNAHTIYDHTSYDTVLPSDGFVRGLEIQADAYAHSLIDAGELARELEVIIQEAKRKLDSPSAVAVESFYALIHDRHRFRRWRIGEEQVLRGFSRDRLVGFYRRWYRPRNTVLVIAGDVTAGQAMPHVERLYGRLPDEPVPGRDGPAEAVAPGFRFREMAGDIAQAHVVLGWRTPGPRHDDTPALDLAGAILSDGRGSRLYRAVRERELATGASAMNYTPRDTGVFLLHAEGDAARAADATAALWAQVRSLRDHGPAAIEVERTQRLFETRWLRRQETMEGQADFLAEWESLGGMEEAERYHARMLTMTPAEVREAMQRHLPDDHASLLVYRPHAHAVFDEPADRVRARVESMMAMTAPLPAVASTTTPARRPTRGTVSLERRDGSVSVFRGPRGVPVLVRRRPGSPIVHLGVYSSNGAVRERTEVAGIGTLMTRASVKGTVARDAAAIAGESELLGGTIGTSVSPDGIGWTFSVPVPRYREATDLLQEVIQQPLFAPATIDVERTIALSQLAQLRDDMYRYPVRLATQAAFGDHPYGRAILGTEESLRAVTAGAVREWHERTIRESSLVVTAVGDVDEHELAQCLSDAFDDVGTSDSPPPPAPAWPHGTRQAVEERDKAQTALAIAFPAPDRHDRRRFAASLLATITSGLGGRFFDELREKRSLAYTVHAWAAERRSAGMFTVYMATDPRREDEARDTLLRECDRLRVEPVGDEELTRATRYTLGAHAIARQDGAVVLGDMIDAWLFGEGLAELDDFDDRVRAVGARDLQAFAIECLAPARRVEGLVRGRVPAA